MTGKRLQVENGDVEDSDEPHRLAGAEPAEQPAPPPWQDGTEEDAEE